MVLTYFCPWTLNLDIAIFLLRLRVNYSEEIKHYKHKLATPGYKMKKKHEKQDSKSETLYKSDRNEAQDTSSAIVNLAFVSETWVKQIQSTTIWSVHITHGIYCSVVGDQTDNFTKGYRNPAVTR